MFHFDCDYSIIILLTDVVQEIFANVSFCFVGAIDHTLAFVMFEFVSVKFVIDINI